MYWKIICLDVVAVIATLGSCISVNGVRDIKARQGSDPSTQASASLSPTPFTSIPSSATSSGSPSIISVPATESSNTMTSTISNVASAGALSSFTTSVRPSATMPASTNVTNFQNSVDDGSLPISPAITPALSVAGVILILSGTVYAMIGIKNKSIQIFLSVAYLTGLSITVLIIYVMNTPVTNAAQGGYLIAAVVPAMALATGALVFKDLTEGLGCVLGGFCFCMWILVLKPGGVIASTGGRAAIFIGVFCVAFFGLAFSTHTRSYGLIGSTSFAGATAIVIGVDCLSRAGLKEFWLYIWALNNNLFPDVAVTYPITRGIRVETAAIIILALLGVISQLRIWRIIQDRRAHQVEEMHEEERQREALEEEIGRGILANNGREQQHWEATYGDNVNSSLQHKDSGVGTEDNSVHKISMNRGEVSSPRRSQSHIVEMIPLDPSGRRTTTKSEISREGTILSIATARDEDGLPRTDHYRPSHDRCRRSSEQSTSCESRLASMDIARYKRDPNIVEDNHHCEGPTMGPVAFERRALYKSIADDTSSVATANSSYFPQHRSAQRYSGSSLLRKISKRSRRNSRQKSLSLEGPNSKYQEDQTSLVSVTRDVEQDRAPSRQIRHIRENSIGMSIRPEDVLIPEDTTIPNASMPDDHSQNPLRHSVNQTTKGLVEEYVQEVGGLSDNGTPSPDEDVLPQKSLLGSFAEVPEGTGSNNTLSRDPSQLSTKPIAKRGLEGRLPEAASKVASVYRTNEWAKHLDRAEKPEADRLSLLKPSESAESDISEEAAVPVDVRALQQTATGESPSLTQKSSQESFSYRYFPTASQKRSKDSLTRKPVGSLSRNSSQESSPSTRVPPLKTRNLRSASTPFVASPIEEGVATTFSPRAASSPWGSSTLLTQRTHMLRDKHLTSPFASPSGLPAPLSSPASLAIYGSSTLSDDDDNMSLAQRRTLLQAHAQSPYLPQHQNTYPPAAASDRRAAMLAAWRLAVQHDLSASSTPSYEAEMRQAALLSEKHRAEMLRQEAMLRSREKDVAWDQAMRREDMQDAHREVLRRMQSGVNARLRSESWGDGG